MELLSILYVFNSIPAQLAKDNKKFQYRLISKNASERTHKAALTWLKEYGLINFCYNLTTLKTPLEGYLDSDVFKVRVADTGLFVAMFPFGLSSHILNNDLSIYKGAIYENVIADALSKNNKPLYYYRKDSGLEIDFIIELDFF